MLSYALTNELASGLNWAGKKLKDQTKQKKAFKEMVLCRCMFGESVCLNINVVFSVNVMSIVDSLDKEVKGTVYKILGDLLVEMEYHIHNYVISVSHL